jgi:predicted phosphodiesterase
METGLKKIIILLACNLIFSACDKFEMRGFLFSYESVDRRFEQSVKWNSENPYKEINVATDEYNIAVMADSHVGSTKNPELFLDAAVNMNATAAVMAGDLTNGHEQDYLTFYEQLSNYDDLLTFPVAGNHDLYFDGWKQFYSLFGSTTYLFTVSTPNASDLFICTDTAGGTLGRDQLEWLKKILETERHKHRYCIIFTHNNLFRIRHTTSTNPFVEELRVLMELCIKHQIDMVIAGHDHARNVVQFGNTTHITLDALTDTYKDPGYLKLTIKDEIEYEFVSL